MYLCCPVSAFLIRIVNLNRIPLFAHPQLWLQICSETRHSRTRPHRLACISRAYPKLRNLARQLLILHTKELQPGLLTAAVVSSLIARPDYYSSSSYDSWLISAGLKAGHRFSFILQGHTYYIHNGTNSATAQSIAPLRKSGSGCGGGVVLLLSVAWSVSSPELEELTTPHPASLRAARDL